MGCCNSTASQEENSNELMIHSRSQSKHGSEIPDMNFYSNPPIKDTVRQRQKSQNYNDVTSSKDTISKENPQKSFYQEKVSGYEIDLENNSLVSYREDSPNKANNESDSQSQEDFDLIIQQSLLQKERLQQEYIRAVVLQQEQENDYHGKTNKYSKEAGSLPRL